MYFSDKVQITYIPLPSQFLLQSFTLSHQAKHFFFFNFLFDFFSPSKQHGSVIECNLMDKFKACKIFHFFMTFPFTKFQTEGEQNILYHGL
jgi:hypothetical protein